MTTSVNFTIRAGLPFASRFRVVNGANVWAALDQVEVRCQLREGKTQASPIVANLHDYMTLAYDGLDIVVSLDMSGSDTRALPLGKAYYDVILSDIGVTDARAVLIAAGSVTTRETITASQGAL
jgi:hypothetical protein